MDIQYLVQGVELFGLANLGQLNAGNYDEEKDFLAISGDGDFFVVRGGIFSVLAPGRSYAWNKRIQSSARPKKS
jgi:beta-galactosidase beta subunit